MREMANSNMKEDECCEKIIEASIELVSVK